ncbi:hypothetical protein R3P38DRAFT_3359932, partial [Favolaschia claudopus]
MSYLYSGCSLCGRAPLPADTNNQPGDVCGVEYTSVELPFYGLMANALHNMPEAALPPIAHEIIDHLATLKDTSKQIGKSRRPCVVLSRGTMGPGPVQENNQICLMATFEKVNPETLPTMFRESLIPVYPNQPITNSQATNGVWQADSLKPLHSCPEWKSACQWIIGIPIVPKTVNQDSRDLPLWSSRAAHFDNKTVRVLERMALKITKNWDSRLSDPKVLESMYNEVHTFKTLSCKFEKFLNRNQHISKWESAIELSANWTRRAQPQQLSCILGLEDSFEECRQFNCVRIPLEFESFCEHQDNWICKVQLH